MSHSDPKLAAHNERFLLKAKLEKRLKKLEAKRESIAQEGIKINQQIKINQEKYSAKMAESLMNDGAINEFKVMLKELNQTKPQQEPAKDDKETLKEQIGKGVKTDA